MHQGSEAAHPSIVIRPFTRTFPVFVSAAICDATGNLNFTNSPQKKSRNNSLASVRRLLDPPNVSATDLLAARAAPNQRLVRAFGLTNTFVSPDPLVHKTFVSHAKSLLGAVSKEDWSEFGSVAIQAVAASLSPSPSDGDALPFDVFIQEVTLRAVLVGFLRVEQEAASFHTIDVRTVAKLITEMWALSKRNMPIPPHRLTLLNHHVRRLVSDESTYPYPLDLIIPTWETMWRVVAAAVAHAAADIRAQNSFAAFHVSPTLSQFYEFVDHETPSVEAFIAEAMRLHPPSRRITRAYPDRRYRTQDAHRRISGFLHFSGHRDHNPGCDELYNREAADVEAVLQSRDIWGEDALIFDPLRHHSSRLNGEQKQARGLVFGYGRHSCIAARWAPVAAAVLVAAILDHMRPHSDYSIVVGPKIGGREGWEGWCVRQEKA